MNSKNIKKHMNAKMRDWLNSITDEEVKKAIKENTIVTGGAMVSLLTGESVHDYDVYFRTKEACITVAKYYTELWNKNHPNDRVASLKVEDDKTETKKVIKDSSLPFSEENSEEISVVIPGRVKVWIQSEGIAEEEKPQQETSVTVPENDLPFPPTEDKEKTDEEVAIEKDEETSEEKPKYRPVFLSSNAITLSDKIQVVTRFYGEVEDIHKNYDFAHCTCSWTSWNNEVQLPTKALECIINKELYYVGSKYPLCSIIRTRKYLERGYHINAGQYVKMAFQLNELNLYDIKTLEDQLTGVDSDYFQMMIEALNKKADESGEAKVDKSYVFELINRMF